MMSRGGRCTVGTRMTEVRWWCRFGRKWRSQRIGTRIGASCGCVPPSSFGQPHLPLNICDWRHGSCGRQGLRILRSANATVASPSTMPKAFWERLKQQVLCLSVCLSHMLSASLSASRERGLDRLDSLPLISSSVKTKRLPKAPETEENKEILMKLTASRGICS